MKIDSEWDGAASEGCQVVTVATLNREVFPSTLETDP